MRSTPWIRLSLVAIAAAALAACGGGEEAAPEEEAGPAEEAAPVVPPDSAATVVGRISFEGTPPESQPIDMSEEPTCADMYEAPPTTQHVVVNDGRLKNVFVYVKSGLDRSFPTPGTEKVLDQEGCRYHPHVFGIQAGQPLAILNSDGILHNINAQPTENRGFNKSQPGAIDRLPPVSFAVPEVMIPVACDVHGWMNAYIGVLEHPYYAVSGEDGSFTLQNLPPGEYEVEAWHERYGTQTATVTVAARDTAEVAFTYSAGMAAGARVPLGRPLIIGPDGARRADR